MVSWVLLNLDIVFEIICVMVCDVIVKIGYIINFIV